MLLSFKLQVSDILSQQWKAYHDTQYYISLIHIDGDDQWPNCFFPENLTPSGAKINHKGENDLWQFSSTARKKIKRTFSLLLFILDIL